VGLAFPTPRRSFNISVIDETLQILKLPLSSMLLVLNHLALGSQLLLSLILSHRVHRGHPLSKHINLLPSLLPIVVRNERQMLYLGEAYSVLPRRSTLMRVDKSLLKRVLLWKLCILLQRGLPLRRQLFAQLSRSLSQNLRMLL
jgi:hypothetical protein